MKPTSLPISLAAANHAFPLLDFAQAAHLLATLGFTQLDVVMIDGTTHYQPSEVVSDVIRAADDIAGTLARQGLEATDLFVIPGASFASLAPNHPAAHARERSREMFLAMIELAQRIGAPGITMVPGVIWDQPDADLRRSAEELNVRAQLAHDRGLRFSVEAHMGSVAATPARAAELLDLAPELELTLDPSHFVAQGFRSADYYPLIARTRKIHARGARDGFLQCRLADSEIDFAEFVARLRQHRYAGTLTVEYLWAEWEGLNQIDVLSETLLLRNALEELLAVREVSGGEQW